MRDVQVIRSVSDTGVLRGRRFAPALLMCSVTAGCALPPLAGLGPTTVPPIQLAASQAQGCNLAQRMALIGQPFTRLADYRLPGQLRVLRPGQGVTRDVMPDRLNAKVDDQGVILDLFCG